MSEFTNIQQRLPAILKALAVGIPAGYLFHRLHTPIPWMIGPMIAVATLNLMGVRMYSPPYARHMGQVVLGSAVSLYFTPPVVTALAANLPAIIAATLSAFLVGGLGALTLSRASGVEGKSTFFASIPGGATAMAVLAERYGAQIAPVAIAHSLRVSIIVILIPFALTYGGFPLVAAAYRPNVPLDPIVLAAQLVLDLQTIVSRELPPTEAAVLTVGSIEGGASNNVIADDCRLRLTLRSRSEGVRTHLREAIARKCASVAAQSLWVGTRKSTGNCAMNCPAIVMGLTG